MVNTTLPAPTTIPNKVLIMGWPMPKPTPKPLATLAVINPTARSLGARHASNVGLVVSELGERSVLLRATRKPINRTGLSRLLTFCSVLPGTRLPVSIISMAWTMVAPRLKTVTAMTVASRKPSRRPMATIPRTPSARFAKPTSSWKGLPFGQPMDWATVSEIKKWPKKPPIPLPATPTPKRYSRKISRVRRRLQQLLSRATWMVAATTGRTE